ncbi:hypothetical protein JCM10213_001692 [Rhodosporidiobolus nylandii]
MTSACFFPNVGKDGAELWTSSSLLSDVSPYYDDLLSSGFAESVTRLGKRPRLPSPQTVDAPPPSASASSKLEPSPLSPETVATQTGTASMRLAEEEESNPQSHKPDALGAADAEADGGGAGAADGGAAGTKDEDVVYEDSDDELDEIVARKAPNLLKATDGDAEVEYRQIVIKDAAWSTYRAVLAYAASGEIALGCLSSWRKAFSLTRAARRNELEHDLELNPLFPLLVSPRSVYQLAHLLQMDDLARRALDEYRIQLTTGNAVHELFSDSVQKFDELRAAAMTFCAQNWHEIKRTAAMEEVRERIAKGELPHAAPILMELLDSEA